jgi:hypothetical protein
MLPASTGVLTFTAVCAACASFEARAFALAPPDKSKIIAPHPQGAHAQHEPRRANKRKENEMANRHRGEIEAELGGERRTLVLTLGALAEIEHAYGGEDLLAIAERFEQGRIKATDAIRVIGAGLRGAGSTMSDDEVATFTVEGGAAGYLRIVADLLKATFATE